MPTDHLSDPPTTRLILCWHKLQDAYTALNIVSHHVLGATVRIAVALYFLACLLLLALRYAVLPNIYYYKTDIEHLVTHVIGQPVTIGTLHASWAGLRPSVTLGDLVIRDKAGRQALILPQVSATLSWMSPFYGTLRLQKLEIDRPDLDVRREADGSLFVAGIPVPTQETGDTKVADWVLSQHEIVIHAGKLRWNDVKRGAPELALDDVNLILRNQWRHHLLNFKATPPAALATPIDLRAEFDHPAFAPKIADATRWKGILYLDLRNAEFAAWGAYIDYPVEVQRGHGAMRAWLDFDHAKAADLTADLSLADTAIRLRKDLPLLDLEQAMGRISVREEIAVQAEETGPTFGSKGHAIGLTNFSMRTRDGMVLPPTTVTESYQPARDGTPAKTSINATLLDLQTMASFAERLPLSPGVGKLLNDMAPRGQLRDFSSQWQGDYPAVSSYDIKGQFAGLALKGQEAQPARPRAGKLPAQAAVPFIPGFENLSGRVAMSDKGGSIDLDSENLQLALPGVFADALMPFDKLSMQANWVFPDKDKVALHINNLHFAQEGLSASLAGTHVMPLNQPAGSSRGVVDFVIHVDGLDVTKVGRFLPQQTPEDLRKWLTGALVGGSIADATVTLKGDLNDFPFNPDVAGGKPKGEFTVNGKIVNGSMNYVPDVKVGAAPLWPLLEDIQGTIAFDRTRMEIHADKAKTHGVALSNVKAVDEDLNSPKSTLDIDGTANGLLQEFVAYTQDSPVEEMIGGFTSESKAGGNAKLVLKLQLPLSHVIDTKVQGKLSFAGDELVLFNGFPPLSSLNGNLEFSERGLSLGGIHANFLGGPVAVGGGGSVNTVAVRADGMLTADGVRKFAGSAGQRLAQRIAGATRYSVAVNLRKKHADVLVESNLQGLALDLPLPLHKEANEVMPARLEMNGLASNDPAISREEVKLSLGAGIAARYEREKMNAERNAGWRLARGAIGVNMPPAQPASGLLLNVNLKSLNVDAWLDLIASLPQADKKEGASESGVADFVSPDLLAAHATELYVFGRKLDNVVLGATLQKDVWQANVDSAQTSGYITYSANAGQGKAKATARLSSLVVPQAAATEVTELLQGKSTSSDIPALDIVADNFELLGKRLGHLELVANNVHAAGSNEWRINKLLVSNPDAELKASGKWVTKEGDSQTSLTYTLDVADAGRLLGRLGFADILRGGKGKMDGDVKWKGAPYAIDSPSLSGQMHLDMASGQFLQRDPGVMKLLGVLSLQSLPRRLTLDFRDVFSEGFAFDTVTMNANIAKGVITTDNLKMQGVDAAVLMRGSADIDKETQDLHVVVVPKLDAGAATVVYGLAVNPVIGLGSFLAQLLLRNPLNKALTQELQVTGSWSNPKVTKLGHKEDNSPQAAPAPGSTAAPNSATAPQS
ncbi:MAG: TIGR02099 family protein [Burkholderiaceae bacterium]|nr:TIGR02099 family protein [Burkholderiaceae bacterium]